jgi:hypothetical protein
MPFSIEELEEEGLTASVKLENLRNRQERVETAQTRERKTGEGGIKGS